MTPDEDTVTPSDLAEAQARWADPQHEPTVDDLFSTPVYGDGFRGDNPIQRATTEQPISPK